MRSETDSTPSLRSLGVVPWVQVDADYRVLLPLPLKGIYGKSFEKLAPALGTSYQLVDTGGFVRIHVVVAIAYLRKVLYAYGQTSFHGLIIGHGGTKVKPISPCGIRLEGQYPKTV